MTKSMKTTIAELEGIIKEHEKTVKMLTDALRHTSHERKRLQYTLDAILNNLDFNED